jgi:hypothetical protein
VYNIYRKEGDLKSGNLTELNALKQAGFEKIASVNDNEFTDKLKEQGKYQYAVTSTDIFGKESDVGFIQSVATVAPYIAVPEQFSVRKTSKGINIEWDVVKQEGVKSYIIYKRSSTETAATKLTTVDISKGVYIDINVKSGVLYYYSLSATGDFGTSDISAEKFAKY